MPRAHATTLRRRRAKSSIRPIGIPPKAASLHSQAQRLASRGSYREAEPAFRQALRIAGQSRSQPLSLAVLLNDYGILCKYTGRFELAGKMYRRALKLVQAEASGHKELLAALYHNLGGLEHARGRYARALPYARRAVEIRRRIRPRDRVSLATDETALGAILVELGQIREARRLYFRALRVCVKSSARTTMRWALCWRI